MLRRFGLLTIWLMISLPPTSSLSQTQPIRPYFGDELLIAPITQLSPNGAYGLRFWTDPNLIDKRENGYSELSLWELPDVQDFTLSDSLIVPSRIVTVQYIFTFPVSIPTVAFSPDSNYVAARINHFLEIFTTPELETVYSIPQDTPGSLLAHDMDWSGNLVGSQYAPGMFMVLDVVTGERYNVRLRGAASWVQATSSGWIITFHPGFIREWYEHRPEFAFNVCTRLLEECRQYSYAGLPPGTPASMDISPDGEAIFLRWYEPDAGTRTWVWRRTTDGEYVLSDEPVHELENELLFSFSSNSDLIPFSYDSRFMLTEEIVREPLEGGDGRMNITHRIRVRDTETYELVVAYDDPCIDQFLPNDSHYLIGSCGTEVHLYSLDQAEPIDTFEIADYITFTDGNEIDPRVPAPEGVYYVSEFAFIDVSDNGEWVVVRFGNGSAIIPILWE